MYKTVCGHIANTPHTYRKTKYQMYQSQPDLAQQHYLQIHPE
ncbi:hypothetical protein EAKF1_ch4210c [Escherichia albertii KF1]|nr:hypothetical protein EAKF1_ch4210c [Escherichia albertii KF1]